MSAALALLSSLLWGTSDYLGGAASRRLPIPSVLGLAQLVALLGLVPLAVVTGELTAERSYAAPAIGAGLVGVVALGAFYRALAVGTMGVVAPIAALGVVVPVVAGLLDGERPSTLQIAGILVAVAGVVLASGPELSCKAGLEPLLLAALAAVGFGVVLLLVAQGSEDGGSVVMVLLTMRLTVVLLLTVLLVALVLSRRRTWELGVRRGDLGLLVAIGIGDVAANGAYAVASQSSLVSVTAVLASLYPVMTALLAYRFDGERLRPIQVGGTALALAGVVLLAAG
ncbi:MAG: DMT family transporter [Mycobacteriales bacterium]|nr:DMT family transporter [Mycobacteriales bacterium]